MLTVTQIASDGGLQRRMLDTAGRDDGGRWEELIARAPAFPPPYSAAPGNSVYHIRLDDHVFLVAGHDLTDGLRDLVMAVLAEGGTS